MSKHKLPRAAKARRPVYLDARSNDDLLRMLLVTVQELSVTRDRLAALETVLAQAGALPPAAVDHFDPTPEWDDERSAARDDLHARLFAPLTAALKAE
jgi:hypothetical protein